MPAEHMRRVAVQAPGQIEIISADIPIPGPGEVLVATSVVGLCGSDLHAIEGTHPFVDLPYFPGHEIVGVIQDVGADVVGFQPGDRVLVEPNIVCGTCVYCVSGRYNLCEHLRVLGFQVPGALADRFVVPMNRLHIVPDTLTDAQAALVEPLSTAMHALRVAGDVKDKKVAVLGCGSIGLLTLIAVLAEGAVSVAVTDPQAEKRNRAQHLGAVAAFDPREPGLVSDVKEALGGRPDCTFDCVSNQSSIEQAIALAQKGGRVIVVGVATGPVSVPLSIIQDQEIRVEGSAMYVDADVERAIALMSNASLPIEELVTATFPLEQVVEAFAAAGTGTNIKVHVQVADSQRTQSSAHS